jgi:hypothetical protein
MSLAQFSSLWQVTSGRLPGRAIGQIVSEHAIEQGGDELVEVGLEAETV